MTTYADHEVLITGLGFPEALRWHDGALWYADWASGRIYRLGQDRQPRLVAQRASFPLCYDLLDLPEGPRPLLVSTPDQSLLLATAADSEPTPYASLTSFGEHPWNEIVLAADGSAYVNNIGFAYDGSTAPSSAGTVGFVVLARPDGTTRLVAEELAFPNGMAITGGGRTLLVAESWGSTITAYGIDDDGSLYGRRVWAETPGLHPDGIDAHPDGTVSFADVGQRCCVRVAEGGEVLDRADLPQPAFDCVVGDSSVRDGGDGPTLFVAVNDFGGDPSGGPAGCILAVPLA